jgi:hypothetical protein
MATQTMGQAAAAEAAVRRFLKTSRRPALLEPGEAPLELRPGTYWLEWRSGRLMLQAWDETRTLCRRIAGVDEQRPGRLELVIERFARREGRLLLVDLERGDRAAIERHGLRLALGERLRRALCRQYPDWKIAELSAEPNLEESLSPVYPRALLRKGRQGWAALMSPPEGAAASGALSFGLIWLDYLRRRERRLAVEGLLLFLPDGFEESTCLRLRWLNPDAAQYRLYGYTEEGGEALLEWSDYGNVDTVLEDQSGPLPTRSPELEQWARRLSSLAEVEAVPRNAGDLSLRVRGLEFARLAGEALLFGLEQRRRAGAAHLEEIARLAQEVARRRRPDAADPTHPLYRAQPERWLESQVRAQIGRIDAALRREPIYGQVPAFAGGERGVIDLLAADESGRLAVLELKASEDLHLPLQALDYWLRVRWHAERGEFARQGYFPGVALSPAPPRLLLIAPALAFHPTTETILRYFRPEVEVERIGLGLEWRRELRVVFRARGAERPEG